MPVSVDKDAPRKQYTTAIIKGGALLAETRLLLREWRPLDTAGSFASRIQAEGVLGNATAWRTRDIVRRVFVPRFLKPTDRPARILKHIMSSRLPSYVFNELLFVFIARKDSLLYDFTVERYWPLARAGMDILSTQTVKDFLMEAFSDGRISHQWSESVVRRVTNGILGLLRDVGLLRGTKKGVREITNYRLSEEGAAILARDLHEIGVLDSSLCSHSDWKLFGLEPGDVLDRLEVLGEHRGFLVQRAGSLVHFTWFVNSMEELIDVLAG